MWFCNLTAGYSWKEYKIRLLRQCLHSHIYCGITIAMGQKQASPPPDEWMSKMLCMCCEMVWPYGNRGGAKEMVHGLGAHTSFGEDPRSFFSTHFRQLATACNSSLRDPAPSSGLHRHLHSHAQLPHPTNHPNTGNYFLFVSLNLFLKRRRKLCHL